MMTTPPLLVILFSIATLLILIIGVIFMAAGNELNKKYSNKLMTARVTLQAITLVILAIYFLYHS